MKKYLSNERGFSLVEVVAAVVLLTIILTSVYYVLIQNSKINASNSTSYSANTVAREVSAMITEECKQVTFDVSGGPNPSSCFSQNPIGNSTDISVTEQYKTNFQVRYTIEAQGMVSQYNSFNLRKVKIEVWDKDDDPNVQSPKATTYTYQREVNSR